MLQYSVLLIKRESVCNCLGLAWIDRSGTGDRELKVPLQDTGMSIVPRGREN